MILKAGDGVFFSFSKSISLEFMKSAMQTAGELGLVPFAYHGIEAAPTGLSSNAYNELLDGLSESKAAFFCVDYAHELSGTGEWIVGQIKFLAGAGLPFYIYIVHQADGDSHYLTRVSEAISLERTRIAVNQEQFSLLLRSDLRSLLRLP